VELRSEGWWAVSNGNAPGMKRQQLQQSNPGFAAEGLRAALPLLADRIERDFAKP
jgi:hypothetical protein